MSDFRCNKCNEVVDVNDAEMFELYSFEEDNMFPDCPRCGEQICIKIIKTFSFECINEEDL